MTIQIQLPCQSVVQRVTPLEFEEAMGVCYLSQLEFLNSTLQRKIELRCKSADKKRTLDPKQKWLGSYYSQEIRKGSHPDVTIRWIDTVLGYGVFANRMIRKHTYIGEYAGVVRKRSFFNRLSNLYCFDYTIGYGLSTPFVIDARRYGNFTRFINHSSKPNVETASVFCDGMMHVILYAITDIAQDAQLLCNYGQKYWEKRDEPHILNA